MATIALQLIQNTSGSFTIISNTGIERTMNGADIVMETFNDYDTLVFYDVHGKWNSPEVAIASLTVAGGTDKASKVNVLKNVFKFGTTAGSSSGSGGDASATNQLEELNRLGALNSPGATDSTSNWSINSLLRGFLNRIGAVNDARATDSTSSWTINAILKGIYNLLAGILAIRGTRSNAGTDLEAGASHLTIGGSDGVNLRRILTDVDGRTKTVLAGSVKDFAPDATFHEDTIEEVTLDPDGNLKMRAQVLTDEGTFRTNFANTSPRVSIGICTFTNNSKVVTGTDFNLADLRVGDYVNIDTHTESTLVQVKRFTATQITLEEPYTGVTVTGTASRQQLKTVTGAGATITVSNGRATIGAGTTADSKTSLSRLVDVAPLVFRDAFSVSQRIVNQTINAGLEDETLIPKWWAKFVLDGTTNTTLKCQTARNPTVLPTGGEIQETIITIPNGLTTAASLEYRVELLTEEVVFYINEISVARHTRVIPSQYDVMSTKINVVNSATPPVSNTNIIVDYIACKNHDKLEMGILSANESIQSSQVPLKNFSFNRSGVIEINTDLLIIDCSQLRTVNLQVVSIGTTGVISTFLTNDLSQLGIAQPAYPIGGGGGITTPVVAGDYNIPTHGAKYLRVRLTIATTAGTTTLFATGSPFAMPIPAPTTQPVSGTLAAVTTVTTLANGQTAHSSASTGSPLRIGGRVSTAADTTLIAGDASDLLISAAQQAIVKLDSVSDLDFNRTAIWTTGSGTARVAKNAPPGNTRNYIKQLTLSAFDLATDLTIRLQDDGMSVTTVAANVMTTSVAHNLNIGDEVIFLLVGGITGIVDGGRYYVLTVPSTTTFTISILPNAGSAIGVGGTGGGSFLNKIHFRFKAPLGDSNFTFNFPSGIRGALNRPIEIATNSTESITGEITFNVSGYTGV